MPDEAGNGNGGPDDREERTGPRPFWSGTLSFGLVNVPVRLFSATRTADRGLRMVDEGGTPLQQRYMCPREDRAISRDEIVRGYDVSDNGEAAWVVVSDEELEALQPEKSREIDLRRFVPVEELDPVFFERAYILVPGEGSSKAYRLLARAMEESGRAGVATFVMRTREYLVAILAREGILRAETMRFHDEVRTPDHVGLSRPEDPPDARVKALVDAIEAHEADDIDREELVDREARELEELVEAKLRRGEDVVEGREDTRREAPGGAEVIDLLEVLRRSLGEGGEDLEKRTKKELYGRAQKLDVEGRSRMTKAELVEAIRRAG